MLTRLGLSAVRAKNMRVAVRLSGLRHFSQKSEEKIDFGFEYVAKDEK